MIGAAVETGTRNSLVNALVLALHETANGPRTHDQVGHSQAAHAARTARLARLRSVGGVFLTYGFVVD